MTIKDGGQVINELVGVPMGSRHPGIVDGLSTNSTINYWGTGNLYLSDQLQLGGEIIQTRAGSQLEMIPVDGISVSSEIVRRVNGVTSTIPFDTDWVTIRMVPPKPIPYLDVISPDYEGYNPDNALFCDSPCVNRWGKVIIEVTADVGGPYAELWDLYPNTPISGPFPAELDDALYVYDLDIADDAVLVVRGINIYYTGSVTIGVNGKILDLGDPYDPIQLTPTTYGDFNASGNGNEAADIARFNAACDSEIDVTPCGGIGYPNCYDPFVDWNCDGVIDCDDRQQYLDNWAGVILDSCGCP